MDSDLNSPLNTNNLTKLSGTIAYAGIICNKILAVVILKYCFHCYNF